MRLQEVAQAARIGLRRLGLRELDVHASAGSFTSSSGLNRDNRRGGGMVASFPGEAARSRSAWLNAFDVNVGVA